MGTWTYVISPYIRQLEWPMLIISTLRFSPMLIRLIGVQVIFMLDTCPTLFLFLFRSGFFRVVCHPQPEREVVETWHIREETEMACACHGNESGDHCNRFLCSYINDTNQIITIFVNLRLSLVSN